MKLIKKYHKKTKTKNNKKSSLKKIPVLITIISSFVPILAVMGYYYEYGWLYTFGLDSSYINISINNLLLSFYDMLTMLWGIEDKLFISTWIILGILVVLIPIGYFTLYLLDLGISFVKYIFSKIKNLNIIEKIVFLKYLKPRHIDSKKEIGNFMLINLLIFIIPLTAIYIFTTFALFGKFAFELGQNQAFSVITNYKDCNQESYLNWNMCTKYIGNNKISYEGYLVFNSIDYIALYNKNILVINKKTGSTQTRNKIKVLTKEDKN